jgi:AraC-like DNA-binding protein
LGRRYRILTHGHVAFGLAMSTAANLREMFEISRRFGDLHYTLAGINVLRSDGRLTGFQSLVDEVPADLKQFTMLRDLASGHFIFRDVWGRDFPFERVDTAIDPAYKKLIAPLLGRLPVRFGVRATTWHWSESIDREPLSQSHAHLHRQFRENCAALLHSARQSADIAVALAAVFQHRGHRVALADAALALGLSTRTLQRKLTERGLSFRDIGNRWLIDNASVLLRDGNLSIATIADALGYLDAASFTRAFRALTGVAPSVYRASAYRRPTAPVRH